MMCKRNLPSDSRESNAKLPRVSSTQGSFLFEFYLFVLGMVAGVRKVPADVVLRCVEEYLVFSYNNAVALCIYVKAF